jgi:hypothetical protein
VLGDVAADFITLVPTPRLKNMDQPYPEDLPVFVRALARALALQMAGALRQPDIDPAPIADKLAAFTWRGVFAQVQQVYCDVI